MNLKRTHMMLHQNKHKDKSMEITAKQARKQLLDIWTKCEFGVKERVKKFHSPRTIQYIIATENYSNTEKILQVIKCIKKQVALVKMEVTEMQSKINKI